MHWDSTLATLAAIPFLGVFAQWVGWRTGLPSLLFLLLFGFLAGPVTGLLNPDQAIGGVLGTVITMAVALLLYEGGLSLRLSEVGDTRPVVIRLLAIGAPVTWILGTVLAHRLLGLPLDLAALLGAVLIVSGPTVVGPILEAVRPTRRVESVLRWESILIDPVGATVGVLVYGALVASQVEPTPTNAVLHFAQTLGVGVVLGAVGGRALLTIMQNLWLPDSLHNGVTVSMVLAVFALCEQVRPESGLFAVTLMGMYLANQRRVDVRHLVDFSETIRVLVVGSLFIVLASRQALPDLEGQSTLGALMFAGALILVVRPVAVALSSLGSVLTWQERAFVAALAPRGIVAAATMSAFAVKLEAHEVPGAERLLPLVFLVIVMAGVIYGLAGLPLARALGLRRQAPQGLLFLGCRPVTVRLARALAEAGGRVLMADLDAERVARAREQGMAVCTVRAGEESLLEREQLEEMGWVLGLAPSPELNRLYLSHFADSFPRAHRFELATRVEVPRQGRVLFRSDATFEELERRLEHGAEIRAVPMDGPAGFAAFVGEHGDRAIPLFFVSPGGGGTPVAAHQRPSPRAGDTLLALVDNDPSLPL